ncbi:MAG: MbcA/ParS/Xre antitoxin family protein [Gammaproteobacteria bacterium]|nr:MbcA/ParS/Xre antitoxin family protein [Gammaproteobacteria bacterium]
MSNARRIDIPPEDVDLSTEESRSDLGQLVMRLFEHWNLDTTAQLSLLGLSPNSRALLTRYREGAAVPGTRDTLDRIGWLLSIHKALRLLYPYNADLLYGWIKRRNTAFDGRTPLEVMTEQGLIGIARVARYLDWQRGR